MKRRLFLCILCLAVIAASFIALPTHANAATSGTCGTSARWRISGKTLYITGSGDMYDYAADEAPWYDYLSSGTSSGGNITKIVVQSGITSIGDYAFHGSYGTTSVSIASSVTEIGKYAFSGIEATSLSIPYGVKIIDDNAFSGCWELTKVTLPSSLLKIGAGAFSQCYMLTEVNIPASVCEFGPAEVTLWEQNPFSSCTGIQKFTVDSNNPILCAENGVLYSKDKTRLIHYPLGSENTSFELPEGVTTICQNAFHSCKKLRSITISKSVKVFESYAFAYCSALKEVTFLGDAPTDWGYDIFYKNTLTAYYPIKNVTWTSEDMQNYGGTVTWTPKGENGEIAGMHGNNIYWLFNQTSGTLTIFGNGEIEYRYSGSEMPWYKYRNQIKAIIVEPGITKINKYAFEYLEYVTTISLPDTLTTLALNAFNDCGSLNNLMLPSSITAIEGSSNTGYPAFIRCESLTDVYYMGTKEEWLSIPKAAYVQNTYAEMEMHFLILHETPPTCTQEGKQSYYAFDDISIYDFMYDLDWNPITTLGTIPTTDHNYGECEITLKPTFAANGQMQISCIHCGHIQTKTIEPLVGKIKEWNIVLEDDYATNFYLQISDSIESTAKVRLTIGNDTVTYNVSDLEKNEDGYFRLTANISAAQMSDFITVMVMNGRDIGSNSTYTVREYCDTILADETHSKYHALVKEMLNYGAMAQMYFGYDTENLANDGITGVASENVPETAVEMTVTDSIEQLNFYGASLVYRDRIAVRYYFTGDMTGMVFTANGKTYTPIAKDGMYYIEIADILPQDLDKQITLTVTDSDGNALTVTYGPMNHMVRMNAKGDEKTQNLMKALYNYHLAAKAL